MDDTCRHEVLSPVWERRMTNHASDDSVGEILVRVRECVCVFTVFIVGYHVQASNQQWYIKADK